MANDKKKTTKKKTSKKKTTKNQASARGSTPAPKRTKKAGKRASSTEGAATPAPARAPAKVAPEAAPGKKARRARPAKAPATKKALTGSRSRSCEGKRKGRCASSCAKGTCTKPQLDGRSLFDRARECKDLDECRGFIAEFNEAVEQANRWLDDMHAQALSAEQTRDTYGEQISDLLAAIDVDRARITELEAMLEQERSKASDPGATKAVLDTLAVLGKEVKSLRAELQRLLDGRGMTSARRQQASKAARGDQPQPGGRRGRARRAPDTASEPSVAYRSAAPLEGRPARRRSQQPPGAFAKHSVLRGAACSLGVGKYGYPPEVCAPASFSRSEAAEILGTYAQHKYSGLAKWAIITGLPIDDIAVPLVPLPRRGTALEGAKPKRQRTAEPSRSATRKAPSTSEKKAVTAGRSNKQVLEQVLLTVARI